MQLLPQTETELICGRSFMKNSKTKILDFSAGEVILKFFKEMMEPLRVLQGKE